MEDIIPSLSSSSRRNKSRSRFTSITRRAQENLIIRSRERHGQSPCSEMGDNEIFSTDTFDAGKVSCRIFRRARKKYVEPTRDDSP